MFRRLFVSLLLAGFSLNTFATTINVNINGTGDAACTNALCSATNFLTNPAQPLQIVNQGPSLGFKLGYAENRYNLHYDIGFNSGFLMNLQGAAIAGGLFEYYVELDSTEFSHLEGTQNTTDDFLNLSITSFSLLDINNQLLNTSFSVNGGLIVNTSFITVVSSQEFLNVGGFRSTINTRPGRCYNDRESSDGEDRTNSCDRGDFELIAARFAPVSNASSVPEPGTIPLFAVSLLGLFLARKKRG